MTRSPGGDLGHAAQELLGCGEDAQARRMARASWETRIFRNDPQGEAEADARFWTRLPPAERVRVAWALSQEMHALAYPDAPPVEPGLSRSIVRIVRR